MTETRPRASQPGLGSPALTAAEIAAATGGRLVRSSGRSVRGAAVDSRAVAPGNLFVALPGEKTDGHRFLGEAIAAGAAALLVREADWSAGSAVAVAADASDVAIVAVADTLSGLHAVARAWRASSSASFRTATRPSTSTTGSTAHARTKLKWSGRSPVAAVR
ncbi:MAG: Mur ligase domain-containing protein, partial [Candidatus Limnocylindrales bacterium]